MVMVVLPSCLASEWLCHTYIHSYIHTYIHTYINTSIHMYHTVGLSVCLYGL
jgi:hypothetical protein